MLALMRGAQVDRHGLFGMDTDARRPLTALMAGVITAERTPASGVSSAIGSDWHVRN